MGQVHNFEVSLALLATGQEMSDIPNVSYKELLKLSEQRYYERLKLTDEQYLDTFKEQKGLANMKFFQNEKGFCWVGKGVLGCPRDQEYCKSCVACTLSDSTGAHLAIETGEDLTFLAAQQLVDCPVLKGQPDVCGCKETTFEELRKFVIKDSPGLLEEVNYRYAAKLLDCKDGEFLGLKGKTKRLLKIDSNDKSPRVMIDKLEEEKIKNFDHAKELIMKQPLCAKIQLTKEFAKHHGQTIFHQVDSQKTTSNNAKGKKKAHSTSKIVMPEYHAILIIGYGEEKDGTRYYIIKNSWGRTWGFLGYAKIGINLIKEVYYPVGTKWVKP